MLKLLLTAVMIAALCGMVICNRKPRKAARYKIIALLLLLLVLLSGGLFMYLPSLAEQNSKDPEFVSGDYQHKEMVAALSGYIQKKYVLTSKIRLIGQQFDSGFAEELKKSLADIGIMDFESEFITVKFTEDSLVLPVEEWAAEAQALDEALTRNLDADAVILMDNDYSTEPLRRLNFYKYSAAERPRLIIMGPIKLNAWSKRMLEEEFFDAVIEPDRKTETSAEADKTASKAEAATGTYTVINSGNLRRNLHLFDLNAK